MKTGSLSSTYDDSDGDRTLAYYALTYGILNFLYGLGRVLLAVSKAVTIFSTLVCVGGLLVLAVSVWVLNQLNHKKNHQHDPGPIYKNASYLFLAAGPEMIAHGILLLLLSTPVFPVFFGVLATLLIVGGVGFIAFAVRNLIHIKDVPDAPVIISAAIERELIFYRGIME